MNRLREVFWGVERDDLEMILFTLAEWRQSPRRHHHPHGGPEGKPTVDRPQEAPHKSTDTRASTRQRRTLVPAPSRVNCR